MLVKPELNIAAPPCLQSISYKKFPYTINNIRKTYNSLVLSLGIRYLLTIVGFYENSFT